MARVTVEDSLEKIPNRFDLILVASKRARELSMTGQEPTVAWHNDKPTVVALREIAAGNIGVEILTAKPEITAAESFDFSMDKRGKLNARQFGIISDDDFETDFDDEGSFDEQVIAAAFVDAEKPEQDTENYDAQDSEDERE